MKKFNRLALIIFFASMFCQSFSQTSANYYISHSNIEPWNNNSNKDAMTEAFGSGNWARLKFNDPDMTTILTSATHFIFIDGSAGTNPNELTTFFINHRTALENWVAAGGRLLLNGGPDLPENLGFGSLSNEAYYDNDGWPVTIVGPLLSQPFDLTAQTMYSGSFSHAKVSGDSLRPLILGNSRDAVILADKPYGDGFLVFGGMTTNNFHSPQPQGRQLLINILHYTASFDITPAAPVANFIATQLDPLVGKSITLIDISSVYSADRTWQISPATFEYADGSDEHSSKPVVRFNEAGSYTVTLTVSNGQGQDSEIKENYITVQNRKNFYWVGGGGYWGSAAHWATSSGGTEFYGRTPTKEDNVIFDANSFSADGQEVFLDGVDFEVFNFTISGTTHKPEITDGYFSIYGAITISSPATISFNKLEFKSDDHVTIDLTNATLGNNLGIEVNGPGTFDFVSPIVADYFYPYEGNIYMHGHTITVNEFGAEGGTAAIWFQNSELHAKRTFYMWSDNDTTPFKDNVNLFLGSSGSDAYFNLQEGLELNEVTLAGEIFVYDDMPVKKITFLPVADVDLLGNKLTAETFNIKGTEDEFITIKNGTFSKTSGTVVAEYVSLTNVKATGGAAFYADKNSEDNGGNTGWIFSTKDSQAITFNALENKTFGAPGFTLSATSSANLPVVFEIVSGPATLSGNNVTVTGVGEVIVKASQAGSNDFIPAEEVHRSFTVTKGIQTISFTTVAARVFGSPAFTVSATSNVAGNAIAFLVVSGPATLTGNSVTLTGAGPVTIKAFAEGNANYLAASVEQTFCANPVKPVTTLVGLDTESPVLTSSATDGNQWFNNGAAINGATAQIYTATEPGVYTVVTSASSCASAASDAQVLIITGLEATPELHVRTYPNPVVNELIIDLPTFNLKHEAIVAVYDLMGKTMMTTKGKGTVVVPMTTYNPGWYTVVVNFGRQRIAKHIIKK